MGSRSLKEEEDITVLPLSAVYKKRSHLLARKRILTTDLIPWPLGLAQSIQNYEKLMSAVSGIKSVLLC